MTWVEMKAELKKKYLPPTFRDRLLDKLSNLKQENVTVKEYMNKYDELVVHVISMKIVVLPFLGFALD